MTKGCCSVVKKGWSFKKLCKGDERPSAVDNALLRAITEADPLKQLHRKLPKNSTLTIQIWHLKQIEKMKKLDKWVPHELATKKKIYHCSEASFSLILCKNNEPFLYQTVRCNK